VDIRLIDGNEVVFGDSEFRLDDGIVYWDHTADTLWDQLSGAAFRGDWAGVRLVRLAAQTQRWADWLAEHPDSLVLDVLVRG
jgi:hypothetical protein